MKPKNFLYMQYFMAAVCALVFASCKKLPDGFLSPTIRYEETPFLIQKGRVSLTSGLNYDGSSIPATVQLLHVYDESGKNVDEIFFKRYTIKGWIAAYDPAADTSLELIEAKQKIMEVTPITVNASSGQIEANYHTINIPTGVYSFDLQISNGAGSRVYNKIGKMQFLDAAYADNADAVPYGRMFKVGEESVSAFAAVPIVTIERLADEPNIVVMKMVDKNDKPFNPANNEIIPRIYPGLNPPRPYLQTLQDYSLKSTVYSDRVEFTYGTLPFPLISKGNGFNIYYRIPTQFFSADDQVKFPDDKWTLNPRFGFRAYVQGKYQLTIKFTDMTHR